MFIKQLPSTSIHLSFCRKGSVIMVFLTNHITQKKIWRSLNLTNRKSLFTFYRATLIRMTSLNNSDRCIKTKFKLKHSVGVWLCDRVVMLFHWNRTVSCGWFNRAVKCFVKCFVTSSYSEFFTHDYSLPMQFIWCGLTIKVCVWRYYHAYKKVYRVHFIQNKMFSFWTQKKVCSGV